MNPDDLFQTVGIEEEEKKQEPVISRAESETIEHSLFVSTWECILHIISILELRISQQSRKSVPKIEFLYKSFAKSIFRE